MALLSRENVLFCDWFLFKKTVQSKRIQSRKQGMWKGYHLSIAMRVFERGTLFVQKRYILEKGKGLDLRASGASPYKHLLSTPHPTPLALHTATRQITYHTLSPPQRHLCVFVSPARFLFFFDYCYFYRDSQREPLRIQERVPYRCQQLAAQLTVPTSFPGFSQREPRNKVAHRSTTLNLPPYRSLNSPHSVRRLDQLPFFLCFNLVLSFF